MRILWFTNSCCNYNVVGEYYGGGWMSSLQNSITSYKCDNKEIYLGICFCMNGQPAKIEQGNTVYYPVPRCVKSKKDKIIDILRYKDITRDEILWSHYISNFKRVIEDFKPDVIEVFGSELYTGIGTIAAKQLNVPCVLHIQGILSLYRETLLPIGVSKNTYLWKDGVKGAFYNFQFLTYWQRSTHREKKILKAVSHVIGRTSWDKHALEILNPKAKYYYGGEILRPCFYEESKRQLPKRPVIVTTSSDPPYKGFDNVLKIANILKNEMNIDFDWKVYGNICPSFFEKLTGIKHTEVNVQLCGMATAEQLKDSMLNATVYLQPSYTENSPNSVAEAQILGLPVVATNVGGTSSMVVDGESGLLFPVTDPYIGAWSIAKLIKDKELNVRLGKNGKSIAVKRHNPDSIVEQLLMTYKEVMNDK